MIDKVVGPFSTTEATGKGFSLGLFMVYGFARQSGKRVRIYSDVGEGTTVCVYLSRHQREFDENKSRAGSATRITSSIAEH